MKKILVFGLTCAVAQMVNAAYLYWQVSSSDITGASAAIEAYEDGSYSINAAKIYSNESGSWSAKTVYLNGDSKGDTVAVPLNSQYAVTVNDLNNLEYSYFVELGNWNGSGFTSVVRSSETLASTLYSSSGATSIVAELAAIPNLVAWHATGYTAVPEPTSAILMLFGAAFLGLKRKNRSLA